MNRDGLVVVTGAGGFIGGHLIGDLLRRGLTRVRGVDIKPFDSWFQLHRQAENVQADLTLRDAASAALQSAQYVFNLAADMGGMGFIENNKTACMLSVLTSTHVLIAAKEHRVERLFYASSACVYAAGKQTDPAVTALREADAYPAQPEDGYGWEKLFSERMCRHFRQDYGLETRVARYHNVYGPHGTWDGGREKAPAAICRKVIEAKLSGRQEIEIWGDGEQTRSFMYIDDCVLGTWQIFEFAHPRSDQSRQFGAGDHQPAGRYRRADRRRAAQAPLPAGRAARGPRPEQRQYQDRRRARLAAVDQPAARARADLRLDLGRDEAAGGGRVTATAGAHFGAPPSSAGTRFDVLGVAVSAVSLDQAVASIVRWIGAHRTGESRLARYVCVSGVHGVMECRGDPALREIHNRAALVTPDGMPLVWLGRLLGHRHMTRVYGPDLMLELCRVSTAPGLRHFFYGGGEGVASLLARRLVERFPGLDVVGTYTPPFRPLLPVERKAVIDLIESHRPDIVWVGLSTPKQERWMADVASDLGCRS